MSSTTTEAINRKLGNSQYLLGKVGLYVFKGEASLVHVSQFTSCCYCRERKERKKYSPKLGFMYDLVIVR